MTSKFEQLVNQYLTESGLPPLSNINKPTGTSTTPSTSGTSTTPSTSSIDSAIDNDPNVVNAKKKAADAIALELKKKQNTITNPA